MEKETVRGAWAKGYDSGKNIAIAELAEMLEDEIALAIENSNKKPQRTPYGHEYHRGYLDAFTDLRRKLKGNKP